MKALSALLIFLGLNLLAASNMDELKKAHENHEVRSHTIWKEWKEKSIEQRIQSAPSNIINYIGLDNKIYGYEGIPTAAPFDKAFHRDFMSAVEQLPKQVKKHIQENLIAIFFVNDLGSSGFSEHIYKEGKFFGSWLLFDQGILSKLSANEWASWRAQSAFRPSKGYELSLKIAQDSANSRHEATAFILLHEIGHIVGSKIKAHPKPHEPKDNPKKFAYSSISWISFEKSIFDKAFSSRKDFQLYRFDRSKLTLKNSKSFIEDLKKTDFISLYGSNSFFEDFAESYAIYVHTVLMKKPYELTLLHKGKTVASIINPFREKRMLKKREFFKKLFGKER